jgi:CRISPR-associated protein Cas2
VYDIPDHKRRQKLANFLAGSDRRVQYFIFKCFGDFKAMPQLHQKVNQRAQETADNVRFYGLTEAATSKALTIGGPPPEPPPTVYII